MNVGDSYPYTGTSDRSAVSFKNTELVTFVLFVFSAEFLFNPRDTRLLPESRVSCLCLIKRHMITFFSLGFEALLENTPGVSVRNVRLEEGSGETQRLPVNKRFILCSKVT